MNTTQNTSVGRRNKTLYMVELALLVAITILMGMTPLGTIRTPALSISLVTIPVAIAAIILGPMGGFICGTVFGLTSLINALIGASGMLSALMIINPVATITTALVPRMLEGVLTAYIYIGLKKLKLKKAACYLGAISCPLLNTLLFMSCIVGFFYQSEYVQGMVSKVGASDPLNFVILLVGVQGLVEAASCCLLAGTVALALKKYLKK